MDQLSIPASDLQSVLRRPHCSAADILAWAAARVASHPAKEAAAPHADRLLRLRNLVGAAAPWQHPGSPLELLLLRVGAGTAAAQLQAMPADQLRALPQYAAAAAALARRSGGGAQPSAAQVRDALCAAAAQLLTASPLEVLTHPSYWQHAATTLAQDKHSAAVLHELELAASHTGSPHPKMVTSAIQLHSDLLAALIGGAAADAAASVAAALPFGGGSAEAEWLAALAGSEGESGGASAVAALRLAQWGAAQLGLSTNSGCGASGSGSWELVQRLGLCVPLPPALPQSLVAAFQAATPALEAALKQQPLAALATGAVDFEQLMAGGDGATQTLASELRTWRAEQAAVGNVAVLSSLSRSEVKALSSSQFEAVRGRVREMGAAGRAALGTALAAAAAGRSPTHTLTAGGAATSAAPAVSTAATTCEATASGDAKSAGGGPVAWERLQPLAWALHSSSDPATAAARLISAALGGCAAEYASAAVEVSLAHEVVSDLRVAFQLEAEVARVDSVTRPDRLLSGERWSLRDCRYCSGGQPTQQAHPSQPLLATLTHNASPLSTPPTPAPPLQVRCSSRSSPSCPPRPPSAPSSCSCWTGAPQRHQTPAPPTWCPRCCRSWA